MLIFYYNQFGGKNQGHGRACAMKNPIFLDGYTVAEWLADACAHECARGFCGRPAMSVRQLEFLLALAQGAENC